mmetsp:Transcript_18703/g.25921  ORF Transcript_18703/g.25921 Transcript_18703/m.25921 type:complete len:101 (-) Transcript_18703:58-360(-)
MHKFWPYSYLLPCHFSHGQAYNEHMNTTEPWAHIPRKEYAGRSIYQVLKSEGLNVEVERLSAGAHHRGYAGSFSKAALAFATLNVKWTPSATNCQELGSR